MNQCEHGCNGCENCIDEPALEQETEREKFEAWALENLNYCKAVPEWFLLRNERNEYARGEVQAASAAWKARAALEAKQAAEHDDVGFELWWSDHEPSLSRDDAFAKWRELQADHIPDAGKMVAAPVQMPEPIGLFSYGAADKKPTYHHGQTDKSWLNKVLDDGVTGGPHRSEFAYTEQQVHTILSAHNITP